MCLIPRNIVNKIVNKKIKKLLEYNKEFEEYRIIHSMGFNKEWFEKIDIPFENKKYCAPKEYDSILTRLYGDYMTLPPVNERYGHGKGDILLSFDKEYDEL